MMRGSHRRATLRRYRRTLNVSAQGEVSSHFDNQVSLDASVRDAFGIPVLRIETKRSDNDRAMERDMLAMCEEVTKSAGYEVVLRSPHARLPGDNAHEMGTARMGASAEKSVVNSFGQCWDVANLYVTDGSVFPTSACQNPTITMMAITSRACDHIAENLASYRQQAGTQS
jgi:choline dehydrogenase-like flavoprotein